MYVFVRATYLYAFARTKLAKGKVSKIEGKKSYRQKFLYGKFGKLEKIKYKRPPLTIQREVYGVGRRNNNNQNLVNARKSCCCYVHDHFSGGR